MKLIKLGASVTASNEKDAEALRARLRRSGTLLVNVMSSAGSGKTTLLSRLIRDLPDLAIGVMEADIESDVDAKAIESLGATAIQVHTDGMCHMDAGMTTAAFDEIDGAHDLVFLENVGNLICPAEYDTGAGCNLMILSVPEGDVLVITKTDAVDYFDFDFDRCVSRVRALNPAIAIFPVSAKTGDGMPALEAWLRDALQRWRS